MNWQYDHMKLLLHKNYAQDVVLSTKPKSYTNPSRHEHELWVPKALQGARTVK